MTSVPIKNVSYYLDSAQSAVSEDILVMNKRSLSHSTSYNVGV